MSLFRNLIGLTLLAASASTIAQPQPQPKSSGCSLHLAVTDEDGRVLDHYSLCEPAMLSAEGYRLIWLHSTSKAEHDADARYRQVARTTVRLSELQEKLASPLTRYRQRAKV